MMRPGGCGPCGSRAKKISRVLRQLLCLVVPVVPCCALLCLVVPCCALLCHCCAIVVPRYLPRSTARLGLVPRALRASAHQLFN